MRVAAYIPHYNGFDMLAEALGSLREQTVAAETVVVDNGSTDDSVSRLRAEFPEVHVLELGANHGFGPALNRAVRHHPADALVFINNDVVCRPDFLAALLDELGERTRSVAGVLVRSDEPGEIASAGIVVDRWLTGFDYLRGDPLADATSAPAPLGPTGGAALVRLDAFNEVGGFDERIFAYLEDVDLTVRMRAAGAECRLAAAAVATHRESATLGRFSARRYAMFGFSRGYLLRRYGLLSDPRRAPGVLAREAVSGSLEWMATRSTAGLVARRRGWKAARGLPRRPIPDDLPEFGALEALQRTQRWQRFVAGLPRRAMWTAVALGLAAIVAALLLVLGSTHERLAGTNSAVLASGVALPVAPGAERCQAGEDLPGDASSLRLYAGTPQGPGGPVAVTLRSGATAATGRIARVRATGPVDVALRGRVAGPGTACVRNLGAVPLTFAGNQTPLADGGAPPAAGRGPEGVRIDYLRSGRESWWSLAGTVAHRFGRFKASFFGAWTLWALAAFVAATWALALVVLVKGVRPRRAALACAVVAAANAVAWGVVTPPFQVPDEPAHLGYAQYLAETGHVPGRVAAPTPSPYSAELQRAYDGLPFSVEGRPAWSAGRERALRRGLREPLSRRAESGAQSTANSPPLYYAVEAVAYRAASGSDLLDRLALMRLVSALFAGLTCLFTFLFLRELLPGSPWAWTVGALAVAFQPLLGFLGGGVTSDNALFAACALVLWLLARTFRRGIDARLAAGLAVSLLAALLCKRAAIAFVPAVGLGVLLVARRRYSFPRAAAIAAATAGLPLAFLVLLGGLVAHRSPGDLLTGGLGSAGVADAVSLSGQISYAWQSFLPRLPFMSDHFTSYPHYPLWDSYFQGFVGRFGWFQFGFPEWVNQVALAVAVVVLALAGAALWRARAALRSRWTELACYSLLAGSVALALTIVAYRYRTATGHSFDQARYLLVLLPLYGGLVALAVRAAGARWARAVGALLVLGLMAQSLFSLLLTIGRYYG